MEIDEITVFAKVVETGRLALAAQILKMPKTTVSAKLASLEKRLGVTLIQRTTRRLHVTQEGMTYYKRCRIALEELEKGEAEIRIQKNRPSGKLKITAPIDIGHGLLPPIIGRYLQEFPDSDIEMVVTNRVVDLVGEGVDLAIRVGSLKDSTLIARKFFDADLMFCATPTYLEKRGSPGSSEEMNTHDFICYPGLNTDIIFRQGRQRVETFFPRTRLVADEMGTLKSLALLHLGIAWLPRFLITQELKDKTLVPILPDWSHKGGSYYAFVYPGQKFPTPSVKEFIRIALDFVVEHRLRS